MNAKTHKVWDRTTRIFHWINVLCVFALLIIGTLILNGKMFGFSVEGKVMIKTVHVYIGYVFAINLANRLIWGFVGGPYSRWKSILPMGEGYGDKLKSMVISMKAGKPKTYLGHNPVGRIAVTVLLLALFIQAITGLVVAGTDIYAPPFGSTITQWIAADGVDHTSLVPGIKNEMINADAYKEMRNFRKPYISTHVYTYYVLLGLIFMHVLAVVITEIKYGENLISVMFTGKKTVTSEPEDLLSE